MQPQKTTTITITREEYRVPGVKGRYLIDKDGPRWYEVSYCPFDFDTTNMRTQIAHTDLHEKAIGAIEAHARQQRDDYERQQLWNMSH